MGLFNKLFSLEFKVCIAHKILYTEYATLLVAEMATLNNAIGQEE